MPRKNPKTGKPPHNGPASGMAASGIPAGGDGWGGSPKGANPAWQKGVVQSRTGKAATIRELVAPHLVELVDKQLAVAKDPTHPHWATIIKELNGRLEGGIPQPISLSGPGEGAIQVQRVPDERVPIETYLQEWTAKVENKS